jgi:hypothetical protein
MAWHGMAWHVTSATALKNDPVKIHKDVLLDGCVSLPRDLLVITGFVLSLINRNERNVNLLFIFSTFLVAFS